MKSVLIDNHKLIRLCNSFVGTLIANLQKHSKSDITIDTLRLMISKSQISSIRTLKSNNAVSPEISRDLLV
jgi:hypothetical protein